MNDDLTLLREYAASQSESAFATLVSRHIHLVYSVALRQVRDPHLAQEVTQAVFIILARKAGSLGDKTIVSGWLCRTARYASADALKELRRRQLREQEAHMQSTDNEPADTDSFSQIAPLLDDAMANLRQKDNDALVLRFFENKSFAEVGGILGISEDAAKMRVSRAVEKLRLFFGKKGIALTTGAVAASLTANCVQAAPIGLMATVTATATAAKGATLSATLTTLVTTTMKASAGLKLKLAASIGLVALLTGGMAIVTVHQNSRAKAEAAEIAKKSLAAYAALTSYSDQGEWVHISGIGKPDYKIFSTKLAQPNLYRIDWTRPASGWGGSLWSVGEGDFMKTTLDSNPTNFPTTEMAFSYATGQGIPVGVVPATFLKLNWADYLNRIVQSGRRKPDQKLGDIDCYVVAITENIAARVDTDTFWIGKKDLLIRKHDFDVSDVDPAEWKKFRETMEKKYPRQSSVPRVDPPRGFKRVETHSNIVVNQVFTKADFAP